MKKVIPIFMSVILLLSPLNLIYADEISQIIGDNNTVVFIDVPSDYWARNEIEYFASKNIVSGVGENQFAPASGVTREQFTKMLVLTFQAPLSTPNESTFSDVTSEKWSYPYVEVSKDFLTGYLNPFGGKPAFHPEEYATREDIAVALVRMMGLSDSDVNDPNYALYKFKDGSSISPNLLPYVSLATERGLISGYTNGTFGPTQGITRAETVVLLNRATKQAATNIGAELELSANVITGADKKEITVMIKTEEGAKVSIDGQSVTMSNNGYSKYEGAYLYKFQSEGTKKFVVQAAKAGKTKTIEVTAKYEIGAPTLTISKCPTESSTETVTISGTVKDTNDSNPIVTINGKSVNVFYGSWSTNVNLKEGSNKFTIIATNSLGKTTTQERSINFGVGAPTLTISKCPTESSTETVTISGTVKDTNDSNPIVTINGKSVNVFYGSWSTNVNLKEGSNKFTIIATNSLGKTTTQERSINFGVGAPTLTISKCPTESSTETATISGTVKDTNDSKPIVTINGKSVDVFYGSWSTVVNLKEGSNKFTIIATNNLGKTTTQERSINFGVGAPTLTISKCPTESSTETATISGTVKDTNDSKPIVTINGKSVDVFYGSWSTVVNLKEGSNKFTIIATNNLGKATTEERTITFKIGSPEIIFTNCPEVTNQQNMDIQGNIKGETTDVKLYLNDQEVNLGWNNSFSLHVSLMDGDNSFVFRAVNSYGKSTSVAKIVKFAEIKQPELTVNDIPSSTSDDTIVVSGTVGDELDSTVIVMINDKKVSSGSGSWSENIKLSEGSNQIIIVATNKFGKSTTIVKMITYTPIVETKEKPTEQTETTE